MVWARRRAAQLTHSLKRFRSERSMSVVKNNETFSDQRIMECDKCTKSTAEIASKHDVNRTEMKDFAKTRSMLLHNDRTLYNTQYSFTNYIMLSQNTSNVLWIHKIKSLQKIINEQNDWTLRWKQSIASKWCSNEHHSYYINKIRP